MFGFGKKKEPPEKPKKRFGTHTTYYIDYVITMDSGEVYKFTDEDRVTAIDNGTIRVEPFTYDENKFVKYVPLFKVKTIEQKSYSKRQSIEMPEGW